MSGTLIRVIDDSRAEGFETCCMDGIDCKAVARFVVATPLGEMGFCDEHVSEIVALLPEEWTDQWITREPFVVTPDPADGVPF